MITIIQTDCGISARWMPSPTQNVLTAPAKPARKTSRMPIRWHSVVDYFVPLGYEDDSGFHYGEQSPMIAAQDRR